MTTLAKMAMEGPLSKWTNVVKGWQYRWFVLDEISGLLSYYTVCCKSRINILLKPAINFVQNRLFKISFLRIKIIKFISWVFDTRSCSDLDYYKHWGIIMDNEIAVFNNVIFNWQHFSIAVQRKNDERSKKRMCAVEGTFLTSHLLRLRFRLHWALAMMLALTDIATHFLVMSAKNILHR